MLEIDYLNNMIIRLVSMIRQCKKYLCLSLNFVVDTTLFQLSSNEEFLSCVLVVSIPNWFICGPYMQHAGDKNDDIKQ